MANISGRTATEAFSENVLETRFENFDQATIDNAKNRIIDVIGCAIGGANAPGNAELVDLVKDWGGKEEATILVHGGKVPAHNATMVNNIMVRSFDFEPLSPLIDDVITPGHVSGTTVMTAIAMGEVRGTDGKELITALLVGDDMTSRMLAAGSGNPAGWDDIGTLTAFGATAIAGRLLGLNRRQMRDAFGIVLNQLGGSLQSIYDATTAFKLTQGLAAWNGIFSARLAKIGWTGPEEALLSKYGYYHLYTKDCHSPHFLTKDLGKKYYSDSIFKPYPCCRVNHGAIDCAFAIVQKHDIDAQDIQEVILYVQPRVLQRAAKPFTIGDFPHPSAIWSHQYTVATALMKKSVKPEHFTEESIRDPQINTLIGKIKVTEKPGSPMYGINLEDGYEIKVIMKDGREFIEACRAAKGDPLLNPMSKDEIIAKFWTNVEFSQTVSRENAERLLTLWGNLEELDNVKKIVELLVA